MERTRSRHIQPDFQFLRFRLAGGEYGMDIRLVREVLTKRAVVRLHGAPSFLDGFVPLRGLYIPVLDLRRRFGLGFSSDEPLKIIVVSLDGLVMGLAADTAEEVRVGGKRMTMRQQSLPGIGSQGVSLIDPASLITSEERAELSRPFAGFAGW